MPAQIIMVSRLVFLSQPLSTFGAEWRFLGHLVLPPDAGFQIESINKQAKADDIKYVRVSSI